MTWLPDLLKNLTVSRSVAGALFIATLSMLILPAVLPKFVEPVPSEWRWLVGGLCIFSAALLVFWLVQGVARALAKVPAAVRGSLPPRALTDLETTFLTLMGSHNPNGSLNIDELNHKQISKLELLQMCKDLEREGLVALNPYSDDLVSLTDNGRAKALRLIKQAKA